MILYYYAYAPNRMISLLDTCCWDTLTIIDEDSCPDDFIECEHVPMTCLNQSLLSNDDDAMLSNNEVRAIFRSPGGVGDGFYTCRVCSRDMRPPCSSVYYVRNLRIQAGICSDQYPDYIHQCRHVKICDQEVMHVYHKYFNNMLCLKKY